MRIIGSEYATVLQDWERDPLAEMLAKRFALLGDYLKKQNKNATYDITQPQIVKLLRFHQTGKDSSGRQMSLPRHTKWLTSWEVLGQITYWVKHAVLDVGYFLDSPKNDAEDSVFRLWSVEQFGKTGQDLVDSLQPVRITNRLLEDFAVEFRQQLWFSTLDMP